MLYNNFICIATYWKDTRVNLRLRIIITYKTKHDVYNIIRMTCEKSTEN